MSKAKELLENFKDEKSINENYGDELNRLAKEFKEVSKNMRGSSVDSDTEIWLDLGVKLGIITENQSNKFKEKI